MKKSISFMLACVLLLSMAMPVSADAAEPTVQPRFTHIISASAGLQISNWGVASCSGSLNTRTDYPVKIYIRLQQLNNSSWSTIKEWEITDVGCVCDTRYYAVYSGYYYRVGVVCFVYDNDGNILETTHVEKQVHYA